MQWLFKSLEEMLVSMGGTVVQNDYKTIANYWVFYQDNAYA
jgi:hypothetical protein